MNYEIIVLLSIIAVGVFLQVTKRWVRWPFSLRSLFWCGGFSYLLLLALPGIFVWQSLDTLIQVVFLAGMAILFSWILAYHKV